MNTVSRSRPTGEISRLHQSFLAEKRRLAARGRSTALYYGPRLQGEWFAPARYKT
jgi:hypothetical protein